MKISIYDDFSLPRIIDSGQCFRAKKFSDGVFRFVTGTHILYISETAPGSFDVSCSQEEWYAVWYDYFDLSTDYAAIRAGIPAEDRYLTAAAEAGKGIRILRQNPLEMLITSIITQRKSIPAIRGAVELLCKAAGEKRQTERENLYLFPTAEALHAMPEEVLSACKLGYRAPYVKDAIEKVYSGELEPEALAAYPDAELLEKLMTVKGVGVKVAACVALFGYHRTTAAPVDVWIRRVIDEHYNGADPFPGFGERAGILQQYLFYYAQTGQDMQK